MLGIDYQGVGIIITAVFAGIASVVSAFAARQGASIKRSVSTNGDSRELGQIASDIAKTAAPDPAPPTPTP